MKNKFLAGIGVAVLTLGLGTAVYADANNWSFRDMLPFMKQMHPEASEQQLYNMYESCHGKDGAMTRNGGPMMWNTNSLQDS